MPKEVEITITVNGSNYNLKGIPESAFRAFQNNTKQHFPDAGDDAWANALTEVILSYTTHESYFMTDIPKENSVALEDTLARVGWGFGELHAYLLRSAILPGALRIISFTEEDKKSIHLGTVIMTGLRKETFDKIEEKIEVPTESFLGLMFEGFTKGVITITPQDAFSTIESSRS